MVKQQINEKNYIKRLITSHLNTTDTWQLIPILTAFTGVDFHHRLSAFPHDISKTDAAKIAKSDTLMFHDESSKPIYFWVKRSRSRVTKHCQCGSLHPCECWLLLVTFLLVDVTETTWKKLSSLPCVTVVRDFSNFLAPLRILSSLQQQTGTVCW